MATKEEKAAAKREELLKGLTELGITLTGGTPTIAPLTGDEDNKKLAKLLKTAMVDAKAAAKQTDTAAEPPSVARGVYDGSGKLVRVYSLADHGENYKDLAEQFATTKGRKGFTTKPHTIELIREPEAEDTEFVKVVGPSSDVVRVYSKSQHGKDYKALADQFIAKFPGRQYKLAK